MSDDKFIQLVQTNGAARITTTYGRSMKYGEEKISCTVTVNCDQDEATINRAGELTFLKAMELVNDGFSVLDDVLREQADKTQA